MLYERDGQPIASHQCARYCNCQLGIRNVMFISTKVPVKTSNAVPTCELTYALYVQTG